MDVNTMHRKSSAALAFLLLSCVAFGLAGCGKQTATVLPAVATEKTKETVAVQGPGISQDAKPPKDEKPAEVIKPVVGDEQSSGLLELLRPGEKLATRTKPAPKQQPGPAFLDCPELPLPLCELPLPHLPTQSKNQEVKPKTVASEPPLASDFSNPIPPQRTRLPSGNRITTPGPDFSQPPPLPILARPQSDREPLTDPSLEASTQAALAASLPVRINPAPFLRLNLPDPFEHAYVSRMLPSEEESVPLRTTSRDLKP
jgi:hypothetical protein